MSAVLCQTSVTLPLETATQANRCTLEDFTDATAGLETRFKLIIRNAEGRRHSTGADRVVVELASTEHAVLAGDVKIVDNKNGSYNIFCIPKLEGPSDGAFARTKVK